MLELLKGLPVRVENWIRFKLENLTWKKILFASIKLAFFVSIMVVGVGIVQGISYNFWKTSISPWLQKTHNITNGFILGNLMTCLIGWCSVAILGFFAILVYGTDRRRLGQLEEVGKENIAKGYKIQELNEQLGKLRNELEQTRQGGIRLLAMFSALDRELLMLLTQDNLEIEKATAAFFESACRRLFEYFRENSDVFRASVYLPDEQNPDFLVIKKDYGVGEVSRRWNQWYIGDHDPKPRGLHRGIPGEVFMKGQGRVNRNIKDDEDFYDPHQPPRSVLPYEATLHTIIHPNDIEKKCGVFCIDSLTYKFTETDLEIAQHVAVRLGWLICWVNEYGTIVKSIKKNRL